MFHGAFSHRLPEDQIVSDTIGQFMFTLMCLIQYIISFYIQRGCYNSENLAIRVSTWFDVCQKKDICTVIPLQNH